MTPIEIGVTRSKVKVTVTISVKIKALFWGNNRGTLVLKRLIKEQNRSNPLPLPHFQVVMLILETKLKYDNFRYSNKAENQYQI